MIVLLVGSFILTFGPMFACLCWMMARLTKPNLAKGLRLQDVSKQIL